MEQTQDGTLLVKTATVTLGNLMVSFSDTFYKDSLTPTWVQEFHFHTAYEFQYIKSGTFFLHELHRDTVLEAGTLCLVPPDCVHCFSAGSEDAQKFHLRFSLSEKHSAGEGEHFALAQGTLSLLKQPLLIRESLLNLLFQELSQISLWSGDPAARQTGEAYLGLIAAKLEELPMEGLLKPKPAAIMQKDGTGSQVCDKMEHFLMQNYHRQLTLAELAEATCFSKRQVQRVCREQFGLSFEELLLKYRMMATASLLGEGKYRITEIAQKVGYQSYDGFFKAFRKYYGKSPREYSGGLKR